MLFLVLLLNLLSTTALSFVLGAFSSFFVGFCAVFVLFFALIILNLEILSLFNGLTSNNIFILTLFEAILGVFILYKNKFNFSVNFNSNSLNSLKEAFKLDKSLVVLSFGFLILILTTLFLSFVMPALEPDSQTYHFFRAVEFVNQKNLSHIITNDIRALIMPINSEIFYAFLFSFKKNFYGYGILSFFSFLTIIFANIGILLNFKFSKRKILWAIFLFSSLSAVIVQIPSLQTDIVVGGLYSAALLFFLESFKDEKQNSKKLFLSSLAVSIAFGVKSTGIIMFPSFLFLILGITFLIKKEKNFKNILLFIKFLVINFLIFSGYNYILNFIDFNNPFSNRAAYLGHRFWGGYKGFISNIIHFFFQAFDFTGFKWGYYLNDKILFIKNGLFNLIQINPMTGCNVAMEKVNIITDEQIVGFGILGFLVFLPCIFIGALKSIKKIKNQRTIFLSLISICFLINIFMLSISVAYMVFSIRFIVAFVALSATIGVISYSKKKNFLKTVVIFFMLFYMILIPTHIKRMPFWVVLNDLKKNGFNLEKFEDDCYRGKITTVLELAEEIYDTILKNPKFKNDKKIAIFKTTDSSLLYLKKLENIGYKINFLPSFLMDKVDLSSYDLIILEGEMQDDNVFNPEDVKINYTLKGDNVTFNNNNGIKCFYEAENLNPTEPLTRSCLSYVFMQKEKNFTLVLKKNFEMKSIKDFVNIYYFKNNKNLLK